MSLSRLFIKTGGFPPFDAAPPKRFEFGSVWGSVEYRGFSDCVGLCKQSYRPYVAQFRPVCCEGSVYLDCELLAKKGKKYVMVETQTWMFVDSPSFVGLRLEVECPDSTIIREIELDDWQNELANCMDAETVVATDAVDVIFTEMWEFDVKEICGCQPVPCPPGSTFDIEQCECIPDEFPVPPDLPPGFGWLPFPVVALPAIAAGYYVYARLVQRGSAFQFPAQCLPSVIVYDYDEYGGIGPIAPDYDILADKTFRVQSRNDSRPDGAFSAGARVVYQLGLNNFGFVSTNEVSSGFICPLEFGTTTYTETTTLQIRDDAGNVLTEFDVGLPAIAAGGSENPPPKSPCFYTQNVYTVTITKVVAGRTVFGKIEIPAEPLCEEYPDPDSILGWLLPYLQSIEWSLGFISVKSMKGGPCECP